MQQCEGYRKDVQMVDQAMLTYDWFIRVQGENFPDFSFPGSNYHPYQPGAFSMRRLVAANFEDGKGDLFMAGGWHEQDPSHSGFFEHLPHGYADKVVKDGTIIDVHEFIKSNWARLPNLTFPERKFGKERWEAIAVKDYYQARHKHAYAILNWAERKTKVNEKDPTVIGPLREAARVIEFCIANHPEPLPSYYPRNLGIIYQRIAYIVQQPEDHWKAMDAYIKFLQVAPNDEDGYETIRRVVAGPQPPRPPGMGPRPSYP